MNTQRLVIGLFAVILGLSAIGLPWALHQVRGRAEEVTLAMSAMVTIAFGLGVVAQAIQHRLRH